MSWRKETQFSCSPAVSTCLNAVMESRCNHLTYVHRIENGSYSLPSPWIQQERYKTHFISAIILSWKTNKPLKCFSISALVSSESWVLLTSFSSKKQGRLSDMFRATQFCFSLHPRFLCLLLLGGKRGRWLSEVTGPGEWPARSPWGHLISCHPDPGSSCGSPVTSQPLKMQKSDPVLSIPFCSAVLAIGI